MLEYDDFPNFQLVCSIESKYLFQKISLPRLDVKYTFKFV